MSLPIVSAEQADWATSIQDSVDGVFDPFATWFSSIVFFPIKLGSVEFPFVVAWLIIAGVVCTAYLTGVQFRGIPTAWDTVRGKYSRDDDPGDIPHFQALTSALSGTVGLGNIAGVGAAVAMGGAGATFWMILAGLIGMATKFAECTLGVAYRDIGKDGRIDGGPFNYLPVAFKWMTKYPAMILTGIYAVAILIFGMVGANMFQSNQTIAQAREVTGGDDSFLATSLGALIFGIILAVLVGLVIIGGIQSIGSVTSKLVPAMGGVYIVACLIVILVNASHVPAAIGQIISGAFNPEGVAGGVLGVMIVGFTRAAFSNEAGLGSAPIAHSAVKTQRPVSEGFVAIFEPLADTVIVCTMTALAIIIAEPAIYLESREQVLGGGKPLDGVLVTSGAFETVIPWFPYILAVAVALFAFSTAITWAYYTERSWRFLFGPSTTSRYVFRGLYCAFIIVGCLLSFGSVLTIADSALFVCGFINLLGVYMLLPEVRKRMKKYSAERASGELLVAPDDRVGTGA